MAKWYSGVLWMVKPMSNETGYLAEEVSKQSVDGIFPTHCF